jgi:hypothetical protein
MRTQVFCIRRSLVAQRFSAAKYSRRRAEALRYIWKNP